MNAFRKLYHFIRPYRSTLALSLVLMVFAGGFTAAITTLAIPLFDRVLVNKPMPASAEPQKLAFLTHYIDFLPGGISTKIAIALVVLTFFKGLCVYYSDYYMSHVGQSVVTDLRNALYRHVLGQSMGFFSLNSTGRLMSRMSGDVEQVQEAVSNVLGDLFQQSIILVAMISLIFFYDWKLAFLSLLIAPLAFGVTMGMGKRIRNVSFRGREDAATLNDQLQQSITGMWIIKAFGMESHEEQRFRRNSARLLRSNMRALSILFLNSPLMELMAVVAFVPLLFYARHHIARDALTLGVFGASLFSLFQMYDPIRKLSRLHVQYQRAMASASRINDLLSTHLEIQDRSGARTLDGVRESIEFRDVCFDYVDPHGETEVLKDINLKVKRNCVIAVVGSSGSGKTTLVGLIPRFYDPTVGSVLIDGTDIREYTQSSLRSQMAIVTQDTFLFNDTVRNNIAYGDVNASEDKIAEAARAALADEFIMNFPMRYGTLIGERGQRLSGGERQRISIARALLKNAPILILDEATSALDSESEKLVQQALMNLMRDRTTFVIAHRLSTIRNADRIIVLEHGQIVESGDHDSLMEQEGQYSRFFRLQNEQDMGSGVLESSGLS